MGNRCEFITLVSGAAAGRSRRAAGRSDAARQRVDCSRRWRSAFAGRIAAFSQGLQELGWTIGRNVRIDYRWGASNTENARKYAAELVAQPPDVVLANGSPAVAALQQVTHKIPIVFVTVPDPIGGGFVDSMSRPGGNITGFTT